MGEFITLLEQMKLKNSVYKDLKWQQSYIPHHKQEMEQLVDALGKQKVAKYLGSISYYSQKQSHGKLGTLVLCLLVLSPILYLQIKGGKKQWQEILVLTSLSLALSIFAAYCWWPKLISLFFHKEIEIYKQGVKMIEQNVELKDYCIVGQSNTRKKAAEEYIESIKGAVSATEFEMHVKCLMNLEIGFSDYEYKLRNDKRLKGNQGVVRDFLNYVKEKRLNSTGLDQDVSKLRYCRQVRDKGDISYSYNWLFRVTRQLLWKVKPYEFIKGKKTAIEHFSEKIKGINGNLTLREALEITCVLNHEDDVDELLRSLKVLLAAYHPDKNKAKKVREVYEQVEKVYRAVSTILEKYERLIGDRIYCDLKEFLEWRLKDISDKAVYGNMVSMVEPKTRIYKRKKGEYEEQKKAMLKIEDGMLEDYRGMIGKMRTLLEKVKEIADYKQLINGIEIINGVEGKKTSEEEKEELKQECDRITNTKKQLEKEIKACEKKIQGSCNELRLKMKEMLVVCEAIEEVLIKGIEDKKKGLSKIKDESTRYLEEKRVANLEKLLEILKEEEKEINDFVKATDSWGEWLQKKARGIKKNIVDSKWSIDGVKKSIKKRIFKESVSEKYGYIKDYENLSNKCEKLAKEIEGCYVERIDDDKGSKFLLYKKVLVPVAKEADNEDSENCHYKHEYRYERAMDIEKKQEELKKHAEELEEKHKTQKEIEKKREADLKENKEKLTHDKEKIKCLKKQLAENLAEIEETEIKVEAAESKAEQERAVREEAEAEKRAITIVLEEAERREIFLKDAKEFFIAQFKLVELYKGLKDKYHNLAHEYAQLRKELKECEVIVDCAAQNPEEMSKEDIFERKLSLINELEKLNNKITKLDEESAQEKPEFNDTKIQDFKNYALEKVAQAKKEAENLRQMLQQELEKLQRVEEEKLQMQAEEVPGSNMNAAEVQSHSSSRFRTIFW
ncbi:MAG: hypothetical protein U0X86_001124 [Wolbachia endosymbiont of Xenopsylla cheopis]